jgi:hypothetical protein
VRGRAVAILLAVAAWPASAAAAPVLFRHSDGRFSARNDPYLNGPALTPAPPSVEDQASAGRPSGALGALTALARANRARARASSVTVPGVLARLYHRHLIGAPAYHRYRGDFYGALSEERHLSGARRTELDAVTAILHGIAIRGALSASRLPVLFQTLERNRQWWSRGPLLSYGQRVEFQGSQLVWEFYPGQGIQLQVLGTFGRANGLYSAGRAHYHQLTQLLQQMIPLAARRGGGLTWEYYFHFDGGSPPWTSAMSQGTGLASLARAYRATRNPFYLAIGRRALSVFSRRPPSGVEVPTRRGKRFVQYTFAPGTSIINAFLQSLIGLREFAQASGNRQADRLFSAGNKEAQWEVPHFDTGAWSLYQPGVEDDLSYHKLVTGFLQRLCALTRVRVYCRTAQRFQVDLRTPPVVKQLTFRGRVHHPVLLRFRLSKISRVGIVLTRGRSERFATSATFTHGVNGVTLPAQGQTGTYGVRIAATDLAGNISRVRGTLELSR